MRTRIALVAALATMAAAPTIAQYYDNGPNGGTQGHGSRRGPPRAIFFSKPGFQGRSLAVDRPIGKLDKFGFDDKPSSIMIKSGGAWRICADDHFGGRCEIIDRSIPDLSAIHMDNKVSSIQPMGPQPGY
ncbi:MAG TPA: beta/gamma crystallin-related protein [Sphingomonas sp.]